MKAKTKKQKMLDRLSNSGGKFVAVTSKKGERFCCKFVSESDCYVNLWRRRDEEVVKLKKTSIAQVG